MLTYEQRIDHLRAQKEEQTQEKLRRSLESLARHRVETADLGRGGNRISRNRTRRLLVVITVRAGCECTRRASDQQHKP